MAQAVTTRRAFLTAGLTTALFTGRLRAAHDDVRIAFVETDADLRRALTNRVDALWIAAPVGKRASLTIEACRAGKDVWVDAPVCRSIDEGIRMIEAARRYGRVVQAGTVARSDPRWQNAREAVRRGDLGAVSFCRMSGGDRIHLIDAIQFVFGEMMPLAVTAQGSSSDTIRFATFRYPGFLASWEAGPEGVSLHGADATLTVGPSQGSAAHWRDFVDCVRTRRRPVSDIETCVRSTTAFLLAELALRHSTTVEFDAEKFAAKQFQNRSPWKVEVS